jgi:hypothetical protein
MNKDKLTTILGAGVAAATAATPIINGVSGAFHQADWIQLASAILMAVFGYFTNKGDK